MDFRYFYHFLTREVSLSTPDIISDATLTSYNNWYCQIFKKIFTTEWLEHRISNPKVTGSTPSLTASWSWFTVADPYPSPGNILCDKS